MEKTTTVGSPKGPRPHLWVTGTDPAIRKQYYAWHRARAQAHYRNEVWTLSFIEFKEVWGCNWDRRGRHPDQLQMIRLDFLAPWSFENVAVVDRPTFHKKQVEIRRFYKTTPRKFPRKV